MIKFNQTFMKLFSIKNILFFLLFNSLFAYSQVKDLFSKPNKLHTISERWELTPESSNGTFLITPYKSIYILPANWYSSPNEQPYSGNGKPEYVAPPGTNYNNIETKFQLSFKTKIFHNLLFGKGDLWVGYTQASQWQIYNESLSRPFREINYEPEVIFNYPLNFNVLGFNMRMAGVAFNHESNGKGLPFSRSWNRIIFHLGFDRDNWSVYVRPWLRLRSEKDDNPDIAQYIGRGDINIIYTNNKSIFTFTGSNNLNFDRNRGNAAFSWSYPIAGNLKGFLLVSHGYGETLIDYNNLQTTVGVGVSLVGPL